MTTINAPTLSQQSLAAGMVAIISAPVRGQALVQITAGGAIVAQAVIGTGQTQRFGPYTAATTVNVRADDGSIEYSSNPPGTIDWSELLTLVGTYDGQLQRVKFPGGLSFWMEWEAATGLWWPAGGSQPYYVAEVVSVTNSTGTQTLTFPTVAHPINFFRSGLGMDADVFGETSISATGRLMTMTLGTEDIVALPTAANRRTAGHYGFVADGASSGWCYIKKDSAEYDMAGSGNSNVTLLTQAWSGALNLTGSMVFTTAASAATAKLRRLKLSLIRG